MAGVAIEEYLEENTNIMVPAREELALIQLEILLSTFPKPGSQRFQRQWISYDWYRTTHALFGEQFQSPIIRKVEKDVALLKAVFIMKGTRRGQVGSGLSSKREGKTYNQFSKGALLPGTGEDSAEISSSTTPRHFRAHDAMHFCLLSLQSLL